MAPAGAIPGLGGGARCCATRVTKMLYGGECHTTNNRMRLTATIVALEALRRPCRVRLTTDSQYVRKGISEWITRWKRNGWMTSERKPVKNEDLWRRLEAAVGRHEVRWEWVRGHSGHPENELADALANRGIDELNCKENK